MALRLTHTFCFLLFYSLVFSQEAKELRLQWGPKHEVSPRQIADGFLGRTEEGTFVVFKKGGLGKEYLIKRFDDELRLELEAEIDLRQLNGQRTKNQAIIFWNGRILLFSSDVVRKEKKEHLYLQEIDGHSLRKSNELKSIVQIDIDSSGELETGNYRFTASRDSAYLLVAYDLATAYSKPLRRGFSVFDKDMNLIHSGALNSPDRRSLYQLEEVQVGPDGAVHFVGLQFKGRAQYRVDGKPNFHYIIQSIQADGSSQTHTIALEEEFISDIKVIPDERGLLHCAGLYSNLRVGASGGFFLKSTDAISGKIENDILVPFSVELLSQYRTAKEMEQMNRRADRGRVLEFDQLELKEAVLREDGSIQMIAEEFRIERQISDIYDVRVRTNANEFFYFNDILVMSIPADESNPWACKIPKRQTSTNDNGRYSSYASAFVGDRIYFMYNDHPNNEFTQEGVGLSTYTERADDSIVNLAIVDSKGRMNRTVLFRTFNTDTYIIPKSSNQLGRSDLYFFGKKGRMHRIGKIWIEE